MDMSTDTSFPNPALAVPDRRDSLDYPLHKTRLHGFAIGLVRAAFRLLMALEVEGLENLPASGGAVVAANHLTTFDIFPLQIALPRPIFYMGKAELFNNPLIHFFFRNMGAFPVFRGERDEWAIRHAQRVLEAGQVLGMFPEGTRSHGRGLKVAKTGAARLAIAAGCPIIPVAVDGREPFFKRFPRRTRVRIRVCAPIHPAPDELPLALTDRLMLTLSENLPSELRGVYTQAPADFR
ncbi:MAG: 1-acyl-sn-glycerol-3-phosphate acyltransferase [Chloroflexi bacterium]|nr:1-acyl-sn-glycerol-3-phosphate acyltransferase [Chloroflexota bacterium]